MAEDQHQISGAGDATVSSSDRLATEQAGDHVDEADSGEDVTITEDTEELASAATGDSSSSGEVTSAKDPEA